MTQRRPLTLVLVLIAVAFVTGFLMASRAAATSGVMSITTDTTLSEDHDGMITIDADNVTLDCAGFAVTGPGVDAAVDAGINITDRTNVTVTNCTATQSKDGFAIRNSTAIDINNNVAVLNRGDGFRVSDGSSGVALTENLARLNQASGFLITDALDITIVGNDASDNSKAGFALKTTSDSDIVNNTAANNKDFSYSLADSHNNTLENNTGANGRFGIDLAESDGNTVRSNRVTGAGRGFAVFDSTSNLFAENISSDNGSEGFSMFTGAEGNTLSENQAHRNGNVGFKDPTTGTGTSGTANTYTDNACTANAKNGSDPTGLCQEEWVALVDTSQGMWHLRHNIDDATTFFYGNPDDVPFMGDWDCDGEATPGLFRTSDAFAYLRNSNSQGIADIRFFFGNPSDIPLAGDFNGDGCDTLSIYRPSEARFYIVNKLGQDEGGLGPAEFSFLFGDIGDKPVVGDWDGDGIDEIGLHREASGLFYWRNTLDTGNADGTIFFGDPGDRFISGDWGIVDGRDTPAVYRPSTTTFYFRHTLTEGPADSQFQFGESEWLPVAGDFGFG